MTLVGFEPTTSRLEVARAIQLRHRAYFCITKSTEIGPLPPTGFEPVTYRLQSDCAKPVCAKEACGVLHTLFSIGIFKLFLYHKRAS